MKKSMIAIVSAFTGGMAGAGITRKMAQKPYGKMKEMSDKHLELFLMMNQWVRIKQEGKSLATFLQDKGFRKIAVYGMSYVGETFLAEIEGTGIDVAYGIDKNADEIFTNVEVFSIDDPLEEVDAVIVTAVAYFDEIKDKLNEKLKCPVLSLEDIILGENG